MRVHSFQIVGRLKSIKVDDFWVDFPKIWGESTLIDPPPYYSTINIKCTITTFFLIKLHKHPLKQPQITSWHFVLFHTTSPLSSKSNYLLL